MLAAPKIARYRCISAIRSPLSLVPPLLSSTLHISGTRARRVTTASIRMLTSRAPSFHWVRSSARRHGPLTPRSPTTSGADQSCPSADMLEEPLQPAVGRGHQRRGRPLAGQMAEVHRPGADHADDDQAQRLQPALAQRDMRMQNPLEGGDGTVRHRAILWRELSRKSPSTALSYPSVVQCDLALETTDNLLNPKEKWFRIYPRSRNASAQRPHDAGRSGPETRCRWPAGNTAAPLFPHPGKGRGLSFRPA